MHINCYDLRGLQLLRQTPATAYEESASQPSPPRTSPVQQLAKNQCSIQSIENTLRACHHPDESRPLDQQRVETSMPRRSRNGARVGCERRRDETTGPQYDGATEGTAEYVGYRLGRENSSLIVERPEIVIQWFQTLQPCETRTRR